MRIGIDARSVGPGHGGIGTYVQELVRALGQVDCENQYVVFCSAQKGPEPLSDAPNVVEAICSTTMLDRRWEQLELPTLAEGLELDLLHMTCFGVPVVKPCRTVATVHDVVFRERPDLVDPALAAHLGRSAEFAARYADRIIAVSAHARAAIARVYQVPTERIAVVHEAPRSAWRPVPSLLAASQVRRRFGLEPGYVLSVGSLERKKNVDGLLDAFAGLLMRKPTRPLLVFAGGAGGLHYDIEQAILLRRLEDHVRVLGYVPDDDLPALYGAAGVFAYLSFYEGFGLPPLEALACGTPTIASNATSLPEVVGDAALLVDPERPEAIAEALARVLWEEGVAEQLSTKGLARAQEFSWPRAARETLAVYRAAAAGREVLPCAC